MFSFANQQLKVGYLTFSSVRAVFGRSLPGFRSVAGQLSHAHQPVYTLLSLSKASNHFSEILQQLFGIQNQVSAMWIDPSFIFVRYFTHNQSYRPNTAIMTCVRGSKSPKSTISPFSPCDIIYINVKNRGLYTS